MNGVWIVVTVSALLGLATGLIFRVWAMLIVTPLVAVGMTLVLYRAGFGFIGSVLSVTACLFVCQAAYVVGMIMQTPDTVTRFLADDTVDDDPGDGR